MKWYCDESDYILEYPVEEVLKVISCGGCGKRHQLRQGTLSKEDLATIEQIKTQAAESPQVYLIIEQEAITQAYKTVQHDFYEERRWYKKPNFKEYGQAKKFMKAL